MKDGLYKKIAGQLIRMDNCAKSGDIRNYGDAVDRMRKLEDFLPSGSGIDYGSRIDIVQSTPERIIIVSSYHAMNEVGYHDGWIDFRVIVKPSLYFTLNIRIEGQFGEKYQDIKDYLYEVYRDVLMEEVEDIQLASDKTA